MSECILNAGRQTYFFAGSVSDIPVLNENYPADTEFKYTESGYNFSVMIDKYPSGCTYQWYMNDQPIAGAVSSIYNFIPEDTYATYSIFCVVSNSLGSVTSRTAIVTVYPTTLYIVENSIYNEKLCGDFIYSSPGNIYYKNNGPDSEYFDFCNFLSSTETVKLSNTIPFNLYNKIYIDTYVYQTDMTSIVSGRIGSDFNIYGNTETNISSINKKDTFSFVLDGELQNKGIYFYNVKLY